MNHVNKSNNIKPIRRNNMNTFATLKKSSGDISRLTKEIEKLNSPTQGERKEDTRFWKLERDKAGNGSAIIRFLPISPLDINNEEALPWVRIFSHGFTGPTGKWYIENSLTTLGQKDPVGELNTSLWGDRTITDPTYRVAERKQARNQKRRLNYISNIYVVSDPKNPENEGKVFLFRYGSKIFEKIKMLAYPEFEGDTPVDPFDLWKGANFKIRIRTVDGYPNYDQSLFDVPKPIAKSDEEIEKIWNMQYSLLEFTNPSNFKSYEELQKRLTEVLHSETDSLSTKAAETTPTGAKSVVNIDDEDTPPFDVGDDDELDSFRKLAL